MFTVTGSIKVRLGLVRLYRGHQESWYQYIQLNIWYSYYLSMISMALQKKLHNVNGYALITLAIKIDDRFRYHYINFIWIKRYLLK